MGSHYDSDNIYSEPVFLREGERLRRRPSNGYLSEGAVSLGYYRNSPQSYYDPYLGSYSPRAARAALSERGRSYFSPSPTVSVVSSSSSRRPITSSGYFKLRQTSAGLFKRKTTVSDEGSFKKGENGYVDFNSEGGIMINFLRLKIRFDGSIIARVIHPS